MEPEPQVEVESPGGDPSPGSDAMADVYKAATELLRRNSPERLKPNREQRRAALRAKRLKGH